MKHNIFYPLVLLYACLIAILSGCLPRNRVIKKRIVVEKKFLTSEIENTFDIASTPTITVWVHGTRFINHSFDNQAFKDAPCLRPVSLCTYPSDWLSLMAENLSAYHLEHTYIFGWSGRLNAREREIAAKALYHDLIALYKNYFIRYNTVPYIRLITHSHGGNVALNLVKFKEKDTPIQIKELILLACPVQKQTMDFVNDSLFEKVYSLHSSLDLVQIIAPQIMYRTQKNKKGKTVPVLKMPLLSARYFPPSEKLLQAKIKLNGRAILHGEFTSKRFLTVLSHIISELENPLSHASVPYQLVSTYIT